MAKAQKWFTQNRLLDDFVYHSIVRPKANAMSKQKGWNSFRLTDEQTKFMEGFCFNELKSYTKFNSKAFRLFNIRNLHFDLPWNRTFEAQIDHDL
jgi:hypothetical protein